MDTHSNIDGYTLTRRWIHLHFLPLTRTDGYTNTLTDTQPGMLLKYLAWRDTTQWENTAAKRERMQPIQGRGREGSPSLWVRWVWKQWFFKGVCVGYIFRSGITVCLGHGHGCYVACPLRLTQFTPDNTYKYNCKYCRSSQQLVEIVIHSLFSTNARLWRCGWCQLGTAYAFTNFQQVQNRNNKARTIIEPVNM